MRLENILIYRSVFNTIEKLTDEQAGKLIKKISAWGKGEDYDTKDPYIEGYFSALEPNLYELKEKFDSRVERNRENGKKGGRPRKPKQTDNNPNNPMGFSETHNNPEKHKEREREKEKEKERERESVPHNTTTSFNQLQSHFDDDPRFYGANKRLWETLHPYEQQKALENVEQYIQWETRDRKDLGFYLRDRKWEMDLTIPTKSPTTKKRWRV